MHMPDLFSATAALCFGLALPWTRHADAGSPPCLRTLALAGAPFLLLAAGWDRGPMAALLAAPALLYALWLFAYGAGRFLASTSEPAAVRWLAALSSTGPLVAAAAWVWSRYEGLFAGFPEPLATLTVVHFSITFGVLPAAMAAWTRAAPDGRWYGVRQAALWTFVLAAPLTALAFALRSELMRPGLGEAACATLFALGFAVWWLVTGPARARWRGVPLLAGFALGAGYSVTQHFGWPFLGIPEMFWTHGSLNLLGSLLLAAAAPPLPPPPGPPAPDHRFPVSAGSEETALFVDTHRRDLGPWSEAAFARLKAALLGYQFYPPATLVRRTQFEEENRSARIGDRIGMGLLLPNLPGLPPVCLPAVVEIHTLFDGPDSARLGYQTTTFHYGCGRWQAEISRQNDRIQLEVRARVRPARWFVWLGLPVYRRFQLGAFHAGLARFQSLLSDASAPRTES